MLSLRLEEYMLPCLNKELFGMECMGCGMQRSIAALISGDFSAAFAFYPAIYTIMLLLLVVLINLFVKFKYAYPIKMGLILVNALIIIGSYFVKISDYL